MKMKLTRYIFISIIGVIILYIIPFIIAQKFVISELSSFFLLIKNNTGFVISFKNTVVFMTIFVPIVVVLGFILAFMTEYLNLGFWVKASIILPITMPAVSIGGFFREVFDYGSKNINALLIIGLIFLWSCIGFTYIIFLISFHNRDKTIEEAAYLDGAGIFKTLFSIIIPLNTEAMILALIISIYNSLKIFKLTYAIVGEHPDYRIFMIQNFLHLKLKELDIQSLMIAADVLLLFIFIILVFILSLGKKSKKNC